MIDRSQFQKAFAPLHASSDTVQQVCRQIHSQKKHRHTLVKGVIAALAAVLSLTVACAAGAMLTCAKVTPSAGVTTAVLRAFDDGGIPTEKAILYDNAGNIIQAPDMEREPTSAETVERLVGAYLSAVDGSMEIDGYTISLDTFLIDESGIGVLTYTVSHPNGVAYMEHGYGEITPPCAPIIRVGSGDPETAGITDSRCYVDKSGSTDTCLRVVVYFGTFYRYEKGQEVYFSVRDSQQALYTVAIRPRRYVPVTTFTADSGETVTLSSLGISIANSDPDHEMNTHEVALSFRSGKVFTVESQRENVMNWVVGYHLSGSFTESRKNHKDYMTSLIFNRLVDVDTVEYVTVEGVIADSDSYINTYWPDTGREQQAP